MQSHELKPLRGPSMQFVTLSDEERERRFWARVDKSGGNGCWLWTRGRTRPVGGYGVTDGFVFNGRRERLAHRVAWLLVRGRIEGGLELDHLCRNRLCVNPDHIEPVTKRTNIVRGVGPTAVNATKTHCNKGHPFDESNTEIQGSTGRLCRACRGLRSGLRRRN
jgi:hypothetical protein